MKYFDAHCHIQFDTYEEDRMAVLDRMAAEGVGGIVVGVDQKSSLAAIELVQGRAGLYASVGLHPNDNPGEAFDAEAFRTMATDPKVVAIGECGLDYFRPLDTSDAAKRAQKMRFAQHIALALETRKPLMIHARPSKGSQDAYEDALDMLASAKREHGEKLSGDFHFFVGNMETARKAFELDFTVSYTAVITFARDYDDVIRFAPLTHILTETDAPYVAPLSRRGQRNDPLAIPEIVAKLAETRGEDLETVRAATVANARRLLKLPD